MKSLALSIAGVFFLTAMAVTLTGVGPADAQECNQNDVVAWSLLPQTTDVDDTDTGFFTETLTLNWAFVDPPFLGAAEAAVGGHEHVINVEYVPDVFFPGGCIGYQNINVSGNLVLSAGEDGTVNSLGWVWDSGNPPPYDEDLHELTVLEP